MNYRRPGNRASVASKRAALSPALGSSERSYVFAIAMKYVKDEEAAADVTQDALLLAHRHRDRFRGDSRYSTWLYRIAVTTALMYLRKKRRLGREVLVEDQTSGPAGVGQGYADYVDPGPGPEERVAGRRDIGAIARCVAEMGDKYERIFWMRYLEGYTETEIATRLDLTLATVKTRAHRARVAVRNRLGATA